MQTLSIRHLPMKLIVAVLLVGILFLSVPYMAGGGRVAASGTWSVMSCPSSSDLQGVSGSASDGTVVAVGYDGTALKYSGGSWTEMTGDLGSGTPYFGVWVNSASCVYAAAEGFDNSK